MQNLVEIHQRGRVLRIALNRPQKRNALNAELCLELVRVIEHAENDPAVGAILLAGNGKSFCAGMDLSEIGSGIPPGLNRAHEQLFTVGARLAKPLVGAVHGASLGGGTGLVANCHVVIGGENATFGLPEIRLGLWPFLVFRAVSAAIGERRAVSLALTGWIFGAVEAREMGLVHEVSADVENRAMEVAREIAAWSPTSVRSGMTFVQEVRGLGWKETGEVARRVRSETFESADFLEGIRAFREKRVPKWPSLG
jgi:enoyl-CoA hydratase/carnithine racemase